ncbi:MAG: HAD family hydrolase [Candidatus Eremiobacterota bacterium]
MLFDLDGTLLDSRRLSLLAAREGLQGLGLPEPSEALVYSLVGLPEREYYAGLVPPELADLARERVGGLELRLLLEGAADLFPGAREALGALRGRRLGLVTNAGRDYCLAAVGSTGLSGFMDIILCSEDAPEQGKAELVRRAVERLGRPAALAGDRSSDWQAARANGVYSIACHWGFGSDAELAGADAHARNFEGLLALL